jgi:8-oxo-dGTP diphosphatase / 2-hydroxy-dATP diphosphatase
MRIMTLVIIHQSPRILLAMKKEGFGAGRWNGYGGKVQAEETIEQTRDRELAEESGGLRVLNSEKRAVFLFHFPHKPEIDCEVHVFRATQFTGEPQETEEMRPQWFDENEIPFDQMWSDDKHWLPLFLAGKTLKGEFFFDEDVQVIDHILNEVESLN